MSNNAKITPNNAELTISVLEDALRLNSIQFNLNRSGIEVEPTGFTHYVQLILDINPNEGNVGSEVYNICSDHLEKCNGSNFSEEAKELYVDLLCYKKYCYSKLIEA